MDFSYILNNKTPQKKKLIEYGFAQDGKALIYKKDLPEGDLQIIVRIYDNKIEATVWDISLDEEYMLANLKNAVGYVAEIQEMVSETINDVVKNCFNDESMRHKVEDYLLEKYGTIPDCPWEDDDTSGVLRVPSGKWYGLLMAVKYSKLGGDSNRLVDVINIKLPPEKIDKLIDNKHYFRAYHMNKKYWITILLDNLLDEKELHDLIDESYELVK